MSDSTGTVQLNSEAIGKARLITDLLELDYEVLNEGF